MPLESFSQLLKKELTASHGEGKQKNKQKLEVFPKLIDQLSAGYLFYSTVTDTGQAQAEATIPALFRRLFPMSLHHKQNQHKQ